MTQRKVRQSALARLSVWGLMRPRVNSEPSAALVTDIETLAATTFAEDHHLPRRGLGDGHERSILRNRNCGCWRTERSREIGPGRENSGGTARWDFTATPIRD